MSTPVSCRKHSVSKCHTLGLAFLAITASLFPPALQANDLLTQDAGFVGLDFSQEFMIRGSATGGTSMQQGERDSGDVESQDIAIKYVVSTSIGDGPLLRIGGGYEGFWFERLSSNIAIPTRLDSLNAILGVDFELFDGWLFRIEAQPGFYGEFGNNVGWDDVNIPFIAAGTYIYDKDLQLIFGMGFDAWRDIIILPAVGVRWAFAPGWVLNLVPPNPRVELYLSDKTLVYAGADLRSGSFRVGPKTGDRGGETRINNAILAYTEVRAGVGGVFNLAPTVSLEAQVGAVAIRRFEYPRADLTYRATGLTPYGTLSLSAKF